MTLRFRPGTKFFILRIKFFRIAVCVKMFLITKLRINKGLGIWIPLPILLGKVVFIWIIAWTGFENYYRESGFAKRICNRRSTSSRTYYANINFLFFAHLKTAFIIIGVPRPLRWSVVTNDF